MIHASYLGSRIPKDFYLRIGHYIAAPHAEAKLLLNPTFTEERTRNSHSFSKIPQRYITEINEAEA